MLRTDPPLTAATTESGCTNTWVAADEDCELPARLTESVILYMTPADREFAGSRYLDESFEVELMSRRSTPLLESVHLYTRPVEDFLPSHVLIKAADDSMRLSFLFTVLVAGPGRDTLGIVSFNTSTCLLPVPHWPRKLHSVTMKLKL